MKNLLISIVAALILCGSTTVSAEPFEKKVTGVTVTNMKTGRKLAFATFEAPISLLRKACPGERDRDCLYTVEGKKEQRLWSKEDFSINPDRDMVLYTY